MQVTGRDLCPRTVGAHRQRFRGRPRTGRGGSAFPGGTAEGGGLSSYRGLVIGSRRDFRNLGKRSRTCGPYLRAWR
jgi:hypothetical protein